MLTAYGLGAYCASKHALEGIAAGLRDELAPTGITVQTINPGAYETGFDDRIAETTYRWHDDAVNFTREADIRATFDEIMQPVRPTGDDPAHGGGHRRGRRQVPRRLAAGNRGADQAGGPRVR
jgi:NAD(P)-dependent dehydrogenase (short-subunit alcohol dehydrogenase family)